MHLNLKQFYQLQISGLVVYIIIAASLKVVKHADKLIPVKNWDVKNALSKLGMSLDHS